MPNIVFKKGNYPVLYIKEKMKDNFLDILKQNNVRLTQRLELYNYLKVQSSQMDITHENIINIIKNKHYIVSSDKQLKPEIKSEPKQCTCPFSMLHDGCKCGAITPYKPRFQL